MSEQDRANACGEIARGILAGSDRAALERYWGVWKLWGPGISMNIDEALEERMTQRADSEAAKAVPEGERALHKEEVWHNGLLAAGFDSPDLIPSY